MKYLFLSLLMILIKTQIVLAALVPSSCDGIGDDGICDTQDLINLVNGILPFIIKTLAPLIFVFGLIFIGFSLVTSGLNPSNLDKAKNQFLNLVVGFLVIIFSFLFIDFLLESIIGESLD